MSIQKKGKRSNSLHFDSFKMIHEWYESWSELVYNSDIFFTLPMCQGSLQTLGSSYHLV